MFVSKKVEDGEREKERAEHPVGGKEITSQIEDDKMKPVKRDS